MGETCLGDVRLTRICDVGSNGINSVIATRIGAAHSFQPCVDRWNCRNICRQREDGSQSRHVETRAGLRIARHIENS